MDSNEAYHYANSHDLFRDMVSIDQKRMMVEESAQPASVSSSAASASASDAHQSCDTNRSLAEYYTSWMTTANGGGGGSKQCTAVATPVLPAPVLQHVRRLCTMMESHVQEIRQICH